MPTRAPLAPTAAQPSQATQDAIDRIKGAVGSNGFHADYAAMDALPPTLFADRAVVLAVVQWLAPERSWRTSKPDGVPEVLRRTDASLLKDASFMAKVAEHSVEAVAKLGQHPPNSREVTAALVKSVVTSRSVKWDMSDLPPCVLTTPSAAARLVRRNYVEYFKTAPMSVRSDLGLMRILVKYNSYAILFADASLRSDRKIAVYGTMHGFEPHSFVPMGLRPLNVNPDIPLRLLKGLRFCIGPTLLSDPSFVLECMRAGQRAESSTTMSCVLEIAFPSVLRDPDFVFKAVDIACGYTMRSTVDVYPELLDDVRVYTQNAMCNVDSIDHPEGMDQFADDVKNQLLPLFVKKVDRATQGLAGAQRHAAEAQAKAKFIEECDTAFAWACKRVDTIVSEYPGGPQWATDGPMYSRFLSEWVPALDAIDNDFFMHKNRLDMLTKPDAFGPAPAAAMAAIMG